MFIYSGSSAVAGLGGTAGERLRLEALQGAAGRRALDTPVLQHALHARFTRTLYTQSYVWRRLRQADPEFLAHTGGRDIPSVLHPRSPTPPSLSARACVWCRRKGLVSGCPLDLREGCARLLFTAVVPTLT